ncbi:MAG: cation transporter [Acidobacteria bacterium]|jgi:cation diffusion facilitator family transporter|nr:MAG: cation transporter [Acidobacteriota bacterium]
MVCKHEHAFYTERREGEKRVLIVLLLTLITMVGEVAGGYLFNSVALLSDGIHMGTHALAFGITLLAYYLARRWSKEGSFTFGTWKVEVLGAYTSAVLLFFLSFLVLQEAVLKLIKVGETKYEEAIYVAIFGLFVNLISAYLLHGEEHDHNLRSAYAHVLSDALTSVLAIGALLGGKYLNLWYLDPISGFLGFFLIARWSLGLMKETSAVLLDREAKNPLVEEVVKAIEKDGKSKVYDIHLLRVYNDRYACIVGIEVKGDVPLEHYERVLKGFESIAHATVELRHCM